MLSRRQLQALVGSRYGVLRVDYLSDFDQSFWRYAENAIFEIGKFITEILLGLGRAATPQGLRPYRWLPPFSSLIIL
jgi:hypothetical protein